MTFEKKTPDYYQGRF